MGEIVGIDKIRIIYVHGFGGCDGGSPFVERLSRSIFQHKLQIDVESHRWKSGILEPFRTGHEYTKACEACEGEAKKVADQISRLPEDEKCYLVGFSLGGRIAWLTAKGLAKRWPSSLRGVLLLGSALDRDVSLGFQPPEGSLLINYYSPQKDYVLLGAENLSGKKTAGRHPLNQEPSFQSHTVQCSHTGNPYNAYPVLADPIALLIAWHAGVRREETSFYNILFPTLGGHGSWHTLYKLPGGTRLQQNLHTCHYRALSETNYRVAWGTSFFGVMAEAERLDGK